MQFHKGNSGPASVFIGLQARLWYGIAAAAVVAATDSTAALPLLPRPLLLPSLLVIKAPQRQPGWQATSYVPGSCK